MHLPDEKRELLRAFVDTDDEELLRHLQDALDNEDYDPRNDFPDFLKAGTVKKVVPTRI